MQAYRFRIIHETKCVKVFGLTVCIVHNIYTTPVKFLQYLVWRAALVTINIGVCIVHNNPVVLKWLRLVLSLKHN